MTGAIHVGIGGWTFAPWRGRFYPKDLPHRRELEFASRQLTSIEINGTFYSTFKPASWARWRDETPDGFVFSIKGSRFCANRRVLASAGDALARFYGQGLNELGDRLGPINWQFATSKALDLEDFAGFLKLLPRELGRRRLRHAVELRHESFRNEKFYALARRYNVAIVYADHEEYPAIDQPTTDFTYARLMRSREEVETGYPARELKRWARRAEDWAKRGDVFVYFINGAKQHAPGAARALMERLATGAP